MKLETIICAEFANFIFEYKVELTKFEEGMLTIETKDKTFCNELLELIEEAELDIEEVRLIKKGELNIITLS